MAKSYLFVQFQPSVVTFAVHVLKPKVPDLTQPDGFHHLWRKKCVNLQKKKKQNKMCVLHISTASLSTITTRDKGQMEAAKHIQEHVYNTRISVLWIRGDVFNKDCHRSESSLRSSNRPDTEPML